MIYIIEIDYADPASEAEWNAWYDGYMRDLVGVPGILTGQRFVTVTPGARRYLAVYGFAGTSVYGEERYKAVGGGGFASAKWRAHIRRRRNLYDGVDHVPEVTLGSRMVLSERDPVVLDAPDGFFVPLTIHDMRAEQADPASPLYGQVRFDDDPARRWVAVLPAAADELAPGSVAVYRPTTPRLVGRA